MSHQMSQEHKKSRGHTDKMYILFGHKIISINLQYPGQNKDWKGDREKERGGGGGTDGGGFGCGHFGAGDPKQEEEARRSGGSN